MKDKKEVKIKISSKHNYGYGEVVPIEVISIGELYSEDGWDVLNYEEVVNEDESGMVQVVNNELRIKDGDASTHMVFVPNQKTVSYLSTPGGELEIGVNTSVARKTEYTNGFMLDLQYELEMNQTLVTSCGLNIAVVDSAQKSLN